ncbi:MAG: hypothetical protein KatS3mg076_0556 [Candidatus Binatia bacterium]|nr:MAG: hypothetical protein KatS3mg076_0556 [Candidatus Binatia bacterium]
MNRLVGSVFVAVLAVAFAACSGGGGGPRCSLEGGAPLLSGTGTWPKFRGDPGNTGRATVEILPSDSGDPELLCGEDGALCLWRRATGGPIVASPVVGSDGTVYVGSADGKVYAYLPEGQEKWPPLETEDAIVAAFALDREGRLYVPSGDRNLYIVDSDTGAVLRSVNLGGFLSAGPTIGGGPKDTGVAYLGTLNGAFFAVCPNAVARWGQALGAVSATAAIRPDGALVVGGTGDERRVRVFEPETGEALWGFSLAEGLRASPVVDSDGTTYLADRSGSVVAVSVDGTARPGFAFDAGAPIEASPALSRDGVLYVADTAGRLWSLDSSTGDVRWVFEADGPVRSSPAIGFDSRIYFGSDSGSVFSLRDLGESPELVWAFATQGPVRSSPALASGADGTPVLYVGSEDGFLYALRL